MKFYLVAFKWNLEDAGCPENLNQSQLTLWSVVPKDPDYVVVGEAEFEPMYYDDGKITAGRIEKLEVKREELAERYHQDRKYIQEELDSLLAISYQPEPSTYGEAEYADFDEEIPL